MENFKFYAPTEVIFGKDVENQTGETAAKYGKKALLVYGKESVVKSGLLGRVEKSLTDVGVGYKW
jgi:alcohol dehydrogenase YqhD (iron-dependent ADH family)